jgi:hypothetical protein
VSFHTRWSMMLTIRPFAPILARPVGHGLGQHRRRLEMDRRSAVEQVFVEVRTSSVSNTEALLTIMSGGPMRAVTSACNVCALRSSP